jgi:hypothetical protein
MLGKYVKNIGLYYGVRTIDTKTHIGSKKERIRNDDVKG